MLLPLAYATTVKHINTPSKTEPTSSIKKSPKLKGNVAIAQTVASPKLTLSTRISNIRLAAIPSTTNADSLRTLRADITQQPRLNLKPSTNDAGIQDQARKTAAEQELEYENRLLLGLTLIFVTGLVITYLISKYRLLL